MTTSRKRRPGRSLAFGMALLAGTVLAGGCGGEEKSSPPARPAESRTARPASEQLATYRGAGFSVGYPKSWQKITGHTVVPEAVFEVGVKSADGRTMRSSYDVLVNEDLPFPIARIADDFVAFSRASTGFQLIANQRIELDGAEAWEIRKGYKSPQGLDLKQVDLFTKTPEAKVVNVRIIFLASEYDAAQGLISSIRSSFRFA